MSTLISHLPKGQTRQENNTRASHIKLNQRGNSCHRSAEPNLSHAHFTETRFGSWDIDDHSLITRDSVLKKKKRKGKDMKSKF